MVTKRLFHSLFTLAKTLRNAVTLLIALLLISSSFSVYADSVVASLDKSTVAENDVVQLTLRADFTKTGKGPDLSVLKKNFDILGQSQNSQFSFNLGSNTALSYWVISLMPKSVGTIEIPSITIGGHESQPLTLTVKNAPQILDGNGNPPVIVKTQVTENAPYLQQQVILTEQLLTSVSLQNANLSTPSNPDLVIERLSDDQMGYQTIKGTQYQVLTRKYLVFPQKSGLINIAPQTVRAMVNTASGKRIIKIQSEPINLQVQPIPASYTSDNWLPSKAVSVSTDLTKTSNTAKVGDTLIWTINISAKDSLPEQIPQITFESTPDYKLYPEPIKFSSEKTDAGITGHQLLKIEVVPTKPGPLTLPDVNVTYWNTTSESTEIANAKTKTINIAALPAPAQAKQNDKKQTSNHDSGKPISHSATSKIDTATPKNDTGAPISLAKKEKKTATTLATPDKKQKTNTSPSWRLYLIIALIVLLAALLTAWLIIFFKRKSPPINEENIVPTLQEFAPLSSNDETSAFKSLVQCCKQDNLPELRSHLLEWSRHRWGDEQIKSVDDIKRLASSVKLTQLLMEAELMLYSNQSSNQWQGTPLAEALEEYQSGQPKKSQASQLKTLYPNF
ncbi:BatD family protein [Marinomonas sp. TI.3.20]|uniref:BatD family protein n=1 Tax=Marinomonas sp. TI.3.20 TaxID=3121296 RepID=UPI00311D721F